MPQIKTLIFVLLFLNTVSAQEIIVSKPYPQTDFRLPLNLPPIISGSFGELRGNHFHSGMDFKTNQREGYPVYAVADGYVSRLRVQAVGFGNAIYLTHQNGYSTVYGHLQRFNDRIGQTVKNYQYRIESFDVDFPLLSVEIPVKKGDIIGWSGNSGSSGGPHLHFEIRDTQTEETINPQLFGLMVPDRVKPIISGLYLYRLNDQPFSEQTPRQYFQLSGAAGNYKLNQSPVINFSGQIGFGIAAFDKNSASENPVGLYSIELLMDGESIYTAVWERFFFEHSRSINSHLDYPFYISAGRRIQKTFVEPGNHLTLYSNVQKNGLITLSDTEIHAMTYIIKDVAGNISRLDFKIKNNPQATIKQDEASSTSIFEFNRENIFETPEFKILAPEDAFYNNVAFNYAVLPKPAGAFSKTHKVHTRLIPVNAAINLWIRPDSTLTPELRDKALIVNSRGYAIGGSLENDLIKASTREFGNFYIKIDTLAPRVTPVNIAEGKVVNQTPKIIFKISDNLAGIGSFRATIDGRWILMEYDAKTATLWHTFDEATPPGYHQFQLVVADTKKNITTYNAGFIR